MYTVINTHLYEAKTFLVYMTYDLLNKFLTTFDLDLSSVTVDKENQNLFQKDGMIDGLESAFESPSLW